MWLLCWAELLVLRDMLPRDGGKGQLDEIGYACCSAGTCFTKHVLKFTTTHCMNSKSLQEVKERKEKRANREQVRESPRLAARARTRRLNADKQDADEQNEDEEEGEEDEGEDEAEEHELPPRRLRMR